MRFLINQLFTIPRLPLISSISRGTAGEETFYRAENRTEDKTEDRAEDRTEDRTEDRAEDRVEDRAEDRGTPVEEQRTGGSNHNYFLTSSCLQRRFSARMLMVSISTSRNWTILT